MENINFTITKHAFQRAAERASAVHTAIENLIVKDVQDNWEDRTKGNHPAKWELNTKIARYKIAEDGSILTVLSI